MSESVHRTGILLVNLGTPKSPAPSDVRPYLREFLMDPRVIDVPSLQRWLIVNLLILPFRPRQSGEAYSKIWTDRGSPLRFYSERYTTVVNMKGQQPLSNPRPRRRCAVRYPPRRRPKATAE